MPVDNSNISGNVILAHWTYTRSEWKSFNRWSSRKKSFFHYMLNRIQPGAIRMIPSVTITPSAVFIGVEKKNYNTPLHQLRRVIIHESDAMNIMEITYELCTSAFTQLEEINILIPKGKLREAIAIQDEMTAKQLIR